VVSPVGENTHFCWFVLPGREREREEGGDSLQPNIKGVTVKFGGNFVVKCCRIRLQKGGGYINPRFIQFITD
jgi:hypothetical protein